MSAQVVSLLGILNTFFICVIGLAVLALAGTIIIGIYNFFHPIQ